MINFSAQDINRDLATGAYRNTSFTSERRAESVIQSYVNEMRTLIDELSPFATPENQADLKTDLEKFKHDYIFRLNAYLQAHSRVASTFITGPANFPVRSNQKKGETADRRRDEWLDHIKRAKAKLHKKYNPKVIANAPISSDDDDATERLQAKIDKAEKLQALMKAANKIVRKKGLTDNEKIDKLAEIGIGEMGAQELLMPDYMGRIGFAPFQLQNNNANIRRMKQRIETIQAEKERQPAIDKHIVIDGTPAVVVESTEINRLQLVFDGKPPVDVRKRLKTNGFRWTPSQGAWQRQLNQAARMTVKMISD